MSGNDEDHCSSCQKKLPPGNQMPDGWAVIRVEVFSKLKLTRYYLYACPKCSVKVSKKQESLFGNEVSNEDS